jgi:hypothetical protein
MAFTLYQAAIPPVVQILNALTAILDKAASYCEERKIDPAVLITDRLAPDMFPFARQIQLASDHAKGIAARLAGIEVPSFSDTETSFAELKARIAKTLDFVKSVSPSQIEGAESREIQLKLAGNEVKFTGERFLINLALPNFYFHATTAYDILRHNGIPVGKRDFLGAA